MLPVVIDVPRSVFVSVLDTTMSGAETAQLIKIPFELWTRVGQRNHV